MGRSGRSVGTVCWGLQSVSAFPRESPSKSSMLALARTQFLAGQLILCHSYLCRSMFLIYSIQTEQGKPDVLFPNSPDRPDPTQRDLLCHSWTTGVLLGHAEACHQALFASPEGTVRSASRPVLHATLILPVLHGSQ